MTEPEGFEDPSRTELLHELGTSPASPQGLVHEDLAGDLSILPVPADVVAAAKPKPHPDPDPHTTPAAMSAARRAIIAHRGKAKHA